MSIGTWFQYKWKRVYVLHAHPEKVLGRSQRVFCIKDLPIVLLHLTLCCRNGNKGANIVRPRTDSLGCVQVSAQISDLNCRQIVDGRLVMSGHLNHNESGRTRFRYIYSWVFVLDVYLEQMLYRPRLVFPVDKMGCRIFGNLPKEQNEGVMG